MCSFSYNYASVFHILHLLTAFRSNDAGNSILRSYNSGVNPANPEQTHTLLRQSAALAWQSLNHLLWPAVCINCRASIGETDNNLCRQCWDRLLECTGGDYCRRCGRDAGGFASLKGTCPDCQGREVWFDSIARCGLYAKSLRAMILGFKNGKTELDSVLALLANAALEGSGFSSEIELFVPVPLHWSRRLARGYNQSRVLAARLRHPTARIGTKLVRIRRTRLQPAAASAAARARNVAGAFAVRRGHDFAGRTICLVDDIKTSGSTLNECARVLKQAGASRVFALVLAIAGQDSG